MKIKPNHKLSILIFILSFSLYFGQKVEFNVPKDIETLQNSIFDFKNDFTQDEAKAAAASDTDFTTTVDLYHLKYEGDQKNPYLTLALKNGAKSKQFIQQAVWNVNMKKVSAKSTKVTVFLEKVIPDSWSKKEVDTKLTKSTGKVEKEIKEFLLNYKRPELSNDDSSETDSVAATTYTTAVTTTDMIAENPKQEKKSKKLQSLFGKKQFIALPATSDTFTKLLQVQPTQPECKDCKGGKYSNWDFDDFNMIYATMSTGLEYYAIQYYGQDMVSGLPHGLVFNDSSPSECKQKFARYNAQLYQTVGETEENSEKALTVVTFKMNSSFVRLEFGNEYLTRLVISNKEF